MTPGRMSSVIGSDVTESGSSALADERGILWRGALALAAAMGVGRFAYTPILPLMERQTSLTADAGAWIATANYVGYLAGALLLIVFPALALSGDSSDVGSWYSSLPSRRCR